MSGFLSVLIFLFAVLQMSTTVQTTAMTYILAPSEKACFYVFASTVGQKISFYFAVQKGGAFDVDYSIIGPGNALINSGIQKKQEDLVFPAPQTGEYSFCFNNGGSTHEEKEIDFELSVKDDQFSVKAELPEISDSAMEKLTPLENSIYTLSATVSTIMRLQKYFRTRDNRNSFTVKSTISRIYWFSATESLLIVAMAALQVYVVRAFFKVGKAHV